MGDGRVPTVPRGCRLSGARWTGEACKTGPVSKNGSLREIYHHTKHTMKGSHENTFADQNESEPLIEDLEVAPTALREELHVRVESAGSVVGPLVLGDDSDRVDKLWRPYICVLLSGNGQPGSFTRTTRSTREAASAHHALTRRTSRDYVFVGGRRVPVPCRGAVPGCAVGQGSRE